MLDKIELGFLGCAVTMAGAMGVLTPKMFAASPTPYQDTFTDADHAAFDRDFTVDGKACALGVKNAKLCFGSSGFGEDIVVGDRLSSDTPILYAQFPVILKTSLKGDDLTTLRYGKTLVLLDEETMVVVDKIDLERPLEAQVADRSIQTVMSASLATPPVETVQ